MGKGYNFDYGEVLEDGQTWYPVKIVREGFMREYIPEVDDKNERFAGNKNKNKSHVVRDVHDETSFLFPSVLLDSYMQAEGCYIIDNAPHATPIAIRALREISESGDWESQEKAREAIKLIES